MLRDRFITLLDERGWTIKKFSEKTGIPYDTLKNIHTGKTTDPQVSTVEAMADGFEISINCLLGKCPHTPPEKELLRNYRECGKRGKSIIRLIARYEAGAIKSERDLPGKHPVPCVKPKGDIHKGILWDASNTENEYTSIPEAYIGIKMPNDDFAPLYCEDDIILFEDCIPHDGDVAAVLIGDRAFIRRVIKDDKGYVLKCLHNYGKDIVIKRMDEVSFIGKAIGIIRS